MAASEPDKSSLKLDDSINAHCPWSGEPIAEDSLTTYRGATVGFCNPGCRDKFEKAIVLFESARSSDSAADLS